MTLTNEQLRELIATTSETVISSEFTEDQVGARLAAWQKAVPEASFEDQLNYILAEQREYSEALLYQVLAQVLPLDE